MEDLSCCPVCNNLAGNRLIELRTAVPTLQNTTLSTLEEARAFPTGQLRMMRCAACSFVWNAKFDPTLINYDGSYNNDVSTSSYYNRHLEEMADRVIKSVPNDTPIHYVEVGCGEGDFMNLVVRKAAGRCVSAVGFDPSFTGENRLLSGIEVHKCFFGPQQLSLVPPEANVICSRHTIEHVPDVHSFMKALATVTMAADRKLFIETPDANWILRNTAFQDFFYEHCSLFTPHSMKYLVAEYGLGCDIKSVYDGQYMLAEASQALQVDRKQLESLNGTDALVDEYTGRRSDLIDYWTSFANSRRANGPVAIWGGASKGVTFALLLASSGQCELECAIDLNPEKQGRFLPATGIQVLSPEDAKRRGVQTVLIMNPNYANEITSLASRMNWHPEFSVLNASESDSEV